MYTFEASINNYYEQNLDTEIIEWNLHPLLVGVTILLFKLHLRMHTTATHGIMWACDNIQV